jgi:hypothetical protein
MEVPMKVIISPGYGAGFASWQPSRQDCLRAATDAALIAAVEAKDASAFAARCEALGLWFSGAEDGATTPNPKWFGALYIENVPDGIRWRITEYDGAEALERSDSIPWWM